MKNYRLLFLFSFFLLAPFFYSCSEDSIDFASQDNLEAYRTPEFLQKSVELILNEITEKMKNSKGEEEFELTQSELDQYIAISGYNGPVPTLNQVNNIISETFSEIQNQYGGPQGYDPIDRAPLQAETKDLLTQILEDGSISNLRANSNYNLVPVSEQQLIEYINNIYIAWENGEINFGEYRGGGWLAFAALGGIIGYSTAGVPGMIIGGIVGGVFGLIVDGK